MITVIDAPLLTEKTVKKVDKIRNRINNEKFNSSICAITLSSNDSDVFDIVPLFNFNFKSKCNEEVIIVGFAENKKAALKMCARLATEYLKLDNKISMREYFKNILLQ